MAHTSSLMRLSYILLLGILYTGCDSKSKKTETVTATVSTESEKWCDKPLREGLSEFKKLDVPSDWFQVYEVDTNVFAIAEPYNFEEVISYLIVGTKKALLFDTGMGFDSISPVVNSITSLPITVINSHTHYDHIGGNYEFNNIVGLNTKYTLNWADNGWPHKLLASNVTPQAICLDYLPKLDTAAYIIKPYTISSFVNDGYEIDLGNKKLEVITLPGHTPDGLGLIDREAGTLWTGDTFYEAPIWLFFDGTNLSDYKSSVTKLAELAPDLNKVFVGHNLPQAKPNRIIDLKNAFVDVLNGNKKSKVLDESNAQIGAQVFEFENFSFLIKTDLLEAYQSNNNVK